MNNKLKDIEVITTHLDRLLELGIELVNNEIKFIKDDSFAIMALSFLAKQIEHSRSIRFLINAEQYSDSMLLARPMLEGLIIITWCYQKNPTHFANLWSQYSVVSDYKLYLEQNQKGFPQDLVNAMYERLKNYGDVFLTKKARKQQSNFNNDTQFPYVHKWLIDENGQEIKISKLLEETEPKLKIIYRTFSGWIHWDVASIAQYMKSKGMRLEIHPNNPRDGALSLTVAYQSLSGLIEIVDHYLKFDLKSKIEMLNKEFLSELKSLQNF